MVRIGFIMDNVQSVKDLEKHFPNLRAQLLYVEDPKFFEFPNQIKLYKGDTLVIEGESLNSASDEADVVVTIGAKPCNVTSLAMIQLVCSPPEHQPADTDENGFKVRKLIVLFLRFNVLLGQVIHLFQIVFEVDCSFKFFGFYRFLLW